MGKLRSLSVFMLGGAILGAVVASFVVPPMLGWYNEPSANSGLQMTQLCNYRDVVRSVAAGLIKGQLIGALAGAVVFLIIGLLVLRRRHDGTGAAPTNTAA